MNKIFYFILVFMLISCSDQLDLKDILGVQINLINKDYEYEDFFTLSGEGYSGLLYSISDTEMHLIIKSIKSQELPLKKEPLKVTFWSQTPIKKNNEAIFGLVSHYYSKDKEFLKFQKDLELQLTKEANYFCYYFKEIEGDIIDIELYLLDIENNKIYIVRQSV